MKSIRDHLSSFLHLTKCTISSSKSQLEDLSNELLYHLFGYLYYHEIIYGFSQLNSRVEHLLETYSDYHLNLVDSELKSIIFTEIF